MNPMTMGLLGAAKPDQARRNDYAPFQPGSIPPGPGTVRGKYRALTWQSGENTAEIFDPHHYASVNGSAYFQLPAPTDPGDVSPLVLPSPSALRNLVGFRNASAAANIYIEFGNRAGPNSWLRLTPGTVVLFDTVVPQDDVFAYADAANGLLIVANSTTPGKAV